MIERADDFTNVVQGSGLQHDLSFALIADTGINGASFKHRMRLLAGSHWQLTDVK